ncbi:MAG TPA: TlyA family rRNA (cytidine-2'-O)-methyltransferase [Elusimicrobia bacterium]|nr:MAG: hypothetical protein A2278_00665 [Elusimicrobia bacterium RIFOXYA12_FULL_49_49]OGS09971.1 MAG: hypothetical protein A2204_06040 [Elusimicrobia bacterium RIFOXYA1_FULL_47_7]OGS10996.1 MAG: hypothetical protein A2386_00240 [Elusimicrobia bacterium RIFOXYB1_FULL_48_9]OGS15168.1 MAG: hypothetical protein A2251_00675 [Elusimicrobia bacterium RIFOXYA2_FULL_47_53]OGS29788.1 MAG: hypothetical protein A2323_01475 [Elusimicrobia bacterium RIFOXYB2_FULL_46_23]HBU70271.1 TlyA family rRNA (cytidine
MKNKLRLDELVLRAGFAKDLKKAQAVIMAGLISSDKGILSKPGTIIDAATALKLKEINPFVSRGGLKLVGALEDLFINPEGRVCMDIGASTGGFTDCLLQKGALKVYAVDVGKNLLDEKLKNNLKVQNIENVNFRYFSANCLKEKVEFVTIDLSFISLEKVLPAVVDCLTDYGEVLALVKPQFEALAGETVRGVVKDDNIRQKYINKIKSFSLKLGFTILGETASRIKGPKGNVEHFIYLKKTN